MNITGEITIGSLLTAASVLISATALAYGWRKDRQLRRTMYADGIRRAAGLIAAKLERWQSLGLQFFDDVQPLLLDVERAAAHGQETMPLRYALLRGLYEHRAVVVQRIAAEQLETAYIDLYGYDPRIHELFLGAVRRMQVIGDQIFDQMRELAWRDIPASTAAPGESSAGTIDGGLRRLGAEIARAYKDATDPVIAAFRAEMLKLIVASDEQILARTVPLSTPLAEPEMASSMAPRT
jgi:hypothetical protein